MECNDAQMWHGVRFWLWCIAGCFSRDAAFLTSARIPTRVPTPIPSSGTSHVAGVLCQTRIVLANPVGQLDADNRDGRVGERFEAGHRRTAPLDRAVVVLNQVVEILARADFHV